MFQLSFCFRKGKSSASEVRRIISEQLDVAIAEIDSIEIDRYHTIHQIRKRCKKIRAVLRLVRTELGKSYQLENVWFRDSARLLSDQRDAQALVESWKLLHRQLPEEFSPEVYTEISRRLSFYRDSSAAEPDLIDSRLNEVKGRMSQARKRVINWPLGKHDFSLLERSLSKSYKKARHNLREAYRKGTMESFHEWRKQTKYHWYHTRLLKNIWPAIMLPRARELKKLSSILGEEHDLALLWQVLTDRAEDFGSAQTVNSSCELIRHRQARLRQAAQPLGSRLFAEKPKQHIYRVKQLWRAWQKLDE